MRWLHWIVAAAALGSACRDQHRQAADVGQDVGTGDVAARDVRTTDVTTDAADQAADAAARTPFQQGVDQTDGHADVESTLGDAEARVGRIRGSTGFTGISSHCRTGDFRLYNAEIELCIQDVSTNRQELFTGGCIVDARQIGSTTEDVFEFTKPRVSIQGVLQSLANTVQVERVEVVRDGSGGGAAVLRTTGHDIPLAQFVAVLGGSLLQSMGLEVTTEYRLQPGADDVEIVTWAKNTRPTAHTIAIGDWWSWGERSDVWRPRAGVDADAPAEFSYALSAGRGASFALVSPDSPMTNFVHDAVSTPWLVVEGRMFDIAPGAEAAASRRIVVGDGSFEYVQRRAMELVGETLTPRQTIELRTDAAQIVADQPLHVLNAAGEVVATGASDQDGLFSFLGPEGAYRVEVAGADGVDITLGSGVPGQAVLPAWGTLSVTIEDAATSSPLAAEVRDYTRDERHNVINGAGDIRLTVGTHHLVLSRGPEYEVAVRDVTITAGETTSEAFVLSRAFDTPGWVAGEFHQHLEPSQDSDVAVRERVMENAAHGVEFVVPTDHDVVTDFGPYLIELGLDDDMSAFPGLEASPDAGHTGLFPLTYDNAARGRGAVSRAVLEGGALKRRSIPELIAAARAGASDVIVQMNHPTGGAGFWQAVRFDPNASTLAGAGNQWTTEHDAVELVNGFGAFCAVLPGWAAYLNFGKAMTAVGNSDTHELDGGSGSPRNYLRIDAAPGAITAPQISAAMLAHQATISSHAFIDFGDGRLPGDTITGSGDVPFHVRVQTPSWANAETLVVLVNGQIVQTLPTDLDTGTFDFDATVMVPIAADSWVAFYAVGPPPAGEHQPGQPTFAFANPIFVDVGGDGWTPPNDRGLVPLLLDNADQGVRFCD